MLKILILTLNKFFYQTEFYIRKLNNCKQKCLKHKAKDEIKFLGRYISENIIHNIYILK